MISHSSWGGDEANILKIHRPLIRAKTDYGPIIFQSAKPSHMKIIESSLNTSLRLALGVFCSSPIESLKNLATEAPPELRKIEMSLFYALKITKNKENRANNHIKSLIK